LFIRRQMARGRGERVRKEQAISGAQGLRGLFSFRRLGRRKCPKGGKFFHGDKTSKTKSVPSGECKMFSHESKSPSEEGTKRVKEKRSRQLLRWKKKTCAGISW